MAEFSTKIKSQHFGGTNYELIEGVALEYYKNTMKNPTKNRVVALIGYYHSYLYNNSNKDTPTTAEHITDLTKRFPQLFKHSM